MSLYQTLGKSLEPMLGERTRAVLEEGVRRLGITPDRLDAAQAEVILKRLVYRELQSKMSPTAARSRVEELLKELGLHKASSGGELPAQALESLAELEAGLKRFHLHLDWPEVGRLRGLINAIKQNPEPQAARSLLREGREVLAGLEEKLQAALLRQSRDIVELESSLQRVQSIGGPKVRRLESYLRRIKEAHEQEILVQAEVQRARALAAEMRKLVESSVVQNPTGEVAITLETREDPPPPDRPTEPQVVLKDPTLEAPREAPGDDFDESTLVLDLDFDSLTAEQQSRIREIDVAEDKRRLEGLCERYAAVLGLPSVAEERARLEAELAAGNPLGERLEAFEEQLKGAYAEALSEARVRYEWLVERLRRLSLPQERTASLWARLAALSETLQAGGLPSELPELERAAEELEAEERALREQRERQARLEQALATLRSEAEVSLSPFRGRPQVEAFLQALACSEVSEDALQALRHQLSELLAQLAREREEESLKRIGLKAQVQALPTLEALEPERENLLARLEEGGSSLGELERAVGELMGRAQRLVAERFADLEARIRYLEQTLKESLIELKRPLQAAREALSQGRIPDPRPLEQALSELYTARRNAIAEELARYEAVARSMAGLGGEELLERVNQARAHLQSGGLPDLSQVHALLGRLRQAQEALRRELLQRIVALLEAYATHRSVGGETALRLKPLCDFLEAAAERLPRLGAGGLLEVRRALEEAERLGAQLAQEYAAAQSLMQELKQADLDSLLNVFDAPQKAPQGYPEALRPFLLRGVEAVALLEDGRLVCGQLPFASRAVQAVFDELGNLAQELRGGPAQLSVVSLPQWVLLLVPLGQKGLVVLAEKALLSRLLVLLERQREALRAL
ncbi:MAG: hypothetical protein N2047_07685 [Meiothermus sp.]|nr:hypothetical protein [Meiothermus sp.]